ncbi:retrovirus-related pol polyprotein from transposon TNT 1-94, partial [Tanacetum coccineum]
MQLRSTVDDNKSMKEEVTILKKDFKQKEDKYIKEFLDIKKLKEKVEDRLFKQDQSVQTVHMLCKPKPFYDEKKKDVPEFVSFFKIKILETQLQEKDNAIRNLKAQVSKMNDISCETYNAKDVTALIEQNEYVRVELEKAQLKEKCSCVTSDSVQTKSYLRLPGMYAIDVKPILHPRKNNKSAHLNYINHLKEIVETVRDIVEEDTFRALAQKVSLKEITRLPLPLVNTSTEASGSKPRSNTKKNRILPAKCENKKKVEDHPRTNKSVWTKVNQVVYSISSKRVVINSNSESLCKTCNKCLNSANHEMCVVNILSYVNATPTVKIVLNNGKQIWNPKGKLSDNSLNKTNRVWKATGKLFTDIGYQWRPTGKKFTLGKLNCGYQWRPTGKKFALGKLCPLTKLFVKCCSKHMTGNRSKLKNFMEKFIGTVRFENDHFGAIMGYGDYVIGDGVISKVYYVEGLGHNLFFVGQFCDSDLEIAFKKHSCFVCDMNGVDLLKGSRSTILYTVCLLSKASKTKSWLWHRRLNHLNFGTINDLARKDLVRGLPRLKFEKDHLCSACQLRKSKKYSHKPKSENTNMEVLYTLH